MANTENSGSSEVTELTMCDVLEEEQELEDDANAVLGGSDDTNCSYDKGYVPRQALYACLTCTKKYESAAVCLACSYKCHDGHDIVELYTKRNFRCDCGNSKFAENVCSLKPDKEEVNSLNRYNQNFQGLYCNCSRPYPDLEDDTPDEMIQCIMCEDWFHGRHVGVPVPDEYFEMICATCMQSHPFLYSYLNKFQFVDVTGVGQTVKSESIAAEKEAFAEHGSSTLSNGIHPDSPSVKFEQKASSVKQEPGQELSEPGQSTNVPKSEQGSVCYLETLELQPGSISSGPAFWPENWRKDLCQCPSCLSMYNEKDCAYLINMEDTILAYEERGNNAKETQYEKGMSALSKLDRVKQMEAVRAYTSMKGQLKEYLKEFANNKRTVCEGDIKEFFEALKKKQKTNGGVPYFCR